MSEDAFSNPIPTRFPKQVLKTIDQIAERSHLPRATIIQAAVRACLARSAAGDDLWLIGNDAAPNPVLAEVLESLRKLSAEKLPTVQDTPAEYQSAPEPKPAPEPPSTIASIFAQYDFQELAKTSGHPLGMLFDYAKGKRTLDEGDINMLARGMSPDHITQLRRLITQPAATPAGIPLGLPQQTPG